MSSVWTPLLDTMSSAARQAWPFIQSAAASGLNAAETIEAMRAGGINTFRRQDMLALIREASGAELIKSDVLRFPKDQLLPIERVRESVTKIVAPFSYTLKLTVLDNVTGEELSITRQAHSNRLMTKEDIESAFIEDAQQFEQYGDVDIQDAEVIDIQRAGSAGFL